MSTVINHMEGMGMVRDDIWDMEFSMPLCNEPLMGELSDRNMTIGLTDMGDDLNMGGVSNDVLDDMMDMTQPLSSVQDVSVGFVVAPMQVVVQAPSPDLDEDGARNFIDSMTFKVDEYMFVPKDIWKTEMVNFMDMCTTHFRGKSNKKVKFEHKLWNALQITKTQPMLYPLVGVIWLSDMVIQIDRTHFGALLCLGKSTSALFNSQGSFPTHGFVELSLQELDAMDIRPYSNNYSDCRFFHRPDGLFCTSSTEKELSQCTYTKPT